jgi:predicted phage-related endonuclease
MKLSEVRIVNLEQGSDAWIAERMLHNCSSDAPVMMGASKNRSRRELLHEKHTGRRKEVSDYTENVIFANGHETEEAARKIIELDMFEDLTPAVLSREVDGLMLMASLDGRTDDNKLLFEHKQWNAVLVENVKDGVLDPAHYWQLEQQLLVSGADQVLFVVSDGTEDKMVKMFYQSTEKRRDELIAGWKQFEKDLAEYEPEAKQEMVVAASVEAFPVITYVVKGSMVESNISETLQGFKDRAEIEMNRVLDTDQDFADKESLNKATVKARETLKAMVAGAKGEFVSFSEFAETAEQIDSILQKMQSQGEKQVKQAKEKKKGEIVSLAQAAFTAHVKELNQKIKPLTLNLIGAGSMPDFSAAIKNKRTIESLKNAVDGVVATAKIEVDQIMAKIVPNQIYLRGHAKDYVFLFADIASIINQDTEPFQAIVKARIAEHISVAEKKIKAVALIKSWEDAKTISAASGEINIVNDEMLFMKQSICDEAIFGDEYDQALIIHKNCLLAIASHLQSLEKAAEEAKVVEEAPVVEETPEAQEPAKEDVDAAIKRIEEELPAMAAGSTKTAEENDASWPANHGGGSTSAEPATEAVVENKPTLLGDLEAWATEFDIDAKATEALNTILMRHGA